MTERPTFSVFGAGLAGPLMGCHLARSGYPVRIYEMRSDPRKAGAAGGRSINLALSRRGMHALEEVGVLDRVRDQALPMRGRMMHAVTGDLTFQPYGTEADHLLYSVSRGGLNELLLDAVEALPDVELRFDHKLARFDPDSGSARFTLPDGTVRDEEVGIAVGADGAFSRIRAAMQRRDRFDYSQDYLEYGYKELSLPPAPGGGFALEPGALHIWPRRSFMMIALPNVDATFTCTLFWPFEGPASFASVRTPDEARAFFQSTFPDVLALIPDLEEQFIRNPVGSLVTVRCKPWRVADRAVLIGDACHAVVPFYGQGMNAAFEDCTVLNACVREHAPSWERVFAVYEDRRKENADALADLALHNFIEMRDNVGSSLFLLRKRTERLLTRLFPSWYVPLYTMVSFTRIPYAEARRKARRQDRIVLAGVALAILLILIVLAAVL